MNPDTTPGHYTILSAIGKGGMGEVWRARDTKLGREVAIQLRAGPADSYFVVGAWRMCSSAQWLRTATKLTGMSED